MKSPTETALAVEGVKSASFSRDNNDRWSGVVYDAESGQEYDVRRLRVGWNVNDDEGRDHRALTLAGAIRKARTAQGGAPR